MPQKIKGGRMAGKSELETELAIEAWNEAIKELVRQGYKLRDARKWLIGGWDKEHSEFNKVVDAKWYERYLSGKYGR